MSLEALEDDGYNQRKAEDHALANLKPMSDAWNPPREEEETFDSGHDGLEAAAKALEESRATVEGEPIVERKYHNVQDGEPIADNETISLNRAADDLQRLRNIEGEQTANVLAQEAQASVDALRGEPQQPQPVEQQAPQPQVTADQLPPNIDPEIADALNKSPKLRDALAQEAVNIQRVQAQAAQAAQTYAAATEHAAEVATQSALASFPELIGLTPAQLPGALKVLESADPQKYARVMNHLQHVSYVNQLASQAKAQQQAAEQAQLQHWQQEQDKQMDSVLAQEPPETVRAVRETLPRLAKEIYGVSVEELKQALATQPIMRSASFQRMMYDAAKYHLAQQSMKDHRANPLPPVHKPGVATERPSADETATRKAREAFVNQPSAKNAAAYLYARRSASR